MLRIHSLKLISWQHPSQWSATTDTERPVYIRYKWGELTIYIGPKDGKLDNAVYLGECVLEIDIGDDHDCQIDWEQVQQATGIEVIGSICPDS